jgi:hypothetical protein
LRSVDGAFENASNKLKLMISETQRGEARLTELIQYSTTQIGQLEAEKDQLMRDKNRREVDIEDIQRQLKQVEEDNASVKHLKAMELQTLKSAHEQALLASQAQAKQLQSDIEHVQDQIAKCQEALLHMQRTKLKDVAQLKNQHQIMKESLEQSKRKLLENAERMAVNGIFKKLKVNFDDLKVMIGELNELNQMKKEHFMVERDIQEK